MVGEVEERNQSPNLTGGSAPQNDIVTPRGVGDVFKEPSFRNQCGKVDNLSDPHEADSPSDSVSSLESVFKIRDMVVKKGPALDTFHASGTSITEYVCSIQYAKSHSSFTEENFQDILFHKPPAESSEKQHSVAPWGQMKPALRRCRIKQNVKRVEPETDDLKRQQTTDPNEMCKRRRMDAHAANQPKGPENKFLNEGSTDIVEGTTQASTLIASERPCPKAPLKTEEMAKTIYLEKVQGLCREVYNKCIAAYAKANGLLQDIRRRTKSQLTLQVENNKLMALLDAREEEHKATLEAKDRQYVVALLAKYPDYATLLATKEKECKGALEAKIAQYTALVASKDDRIQELTEEIGATKTALVVSKDITDATKASMVNAVVEYAELQGQLSVAKEKVHFAITEVNAFSKPQVHSQKERNIILPIREMEQLLCSSEIEQQVIGDIETPRERVRKLEETSTDSGLEEEFCGKEMTDTQMERVSLSRQNVDEHQTITVNAVGPSPPTVKSLKKKQGSDSDAGKKIDGTPINFSQPPVPVCSCTGIPRQCRQGPLYWMSSCCSASISEHPLPMSPSSPGARVRGRKMGNGVYVSLLQRLAAEGYDFSDAVDLKARWVKCGANQFVT